MQEHEKALLLQSLQGKQPAILLAFLMMQRALTLEDLVGLTGLHNDTVRKAVKGLAVKNLLHMQRGERGKQTWLPVMDTLFGLPEFQNPKISDSGATTTTVKLTDSDSQGKTAAGADLKAVQNPKKSDSELDEEQKRIWKVLKRGGVGEPMRTRIARETDYPPEYVLAHLLYAAGEGLGIGLTIHRIVNQDWFPEHWKEVARRELSKYIGEI